MPSLTRLLRQLTMLLTVVNLLFSFTHATPTPEVSQLSPRLTDLSPRNDPLHNAALSHHPKRALTHGTFYRGLWSLALTTTSFIISGPSSSSTTPASYMESFANQVMAKVARNIARGSPEQNAFGWVLDDISITFASYLDLTTHVPPGVPWAVVEEFVRKLVLWRAQRGVVSAFSGNIWGPGGVCVTVVLKVGAAGLAGGGGGGGGGAGAGILDSASEIHGNR